MLLKSYTEGMKKGVEYTGVAIVFACHDGKGNYFLNKRSDKTRDEHHTWDCGGGGLDFGDTVEGTLQKEIKEEYAADVITSEFLGFRDVHREHEGVKTHWIALDFRVLIDPAQAANGEPHKFEEVGWFSIKDFPAPLHSQFPHFLELYKDKLI
jgi:8-oxo-dGTP diphosphatase